MFKSFFNTAAVIFFVLFFATCDNYEFPETPYPRIETLPVINISETGATFQAHIIQDSNEPVSDHGFVWGTSENLFITHVDKIQLGPAQNLTKFDADIKAGLIKGQTYFVKAFVSTGDYFVYGPAVSFKSNGSTPPVIKSFSPSGGTWGDTVTIKGNYFSTVPKHNNVKFGAYESRILSSDDSTITCIVPQDIADLQVLIYLNVSGYQTQAKTPFTLTAPTVESFYPESGTFEDIVTIKGKGFSDRRLKNTVKFNDHIAEILDFSTSYIKVKVPSAISTKENVITVTSNLRSTAASIPFVISAPAIDAISASGEFIGGTIQIDGNNFHPVATGNVVLLDGVAAPILSATSSSIKIQIPEGIYERRSFPIEVIVAEQNVFSQQVLTLQDAWIRKADVPHGQFGISDAVAFAINGMGYVGLGAGNEFWRYSPLENSWTAVAPFPGSDPGGRTSFVIGDKAYVGIGAGAPDNFWSYDPQNDSWSQVADFPALESFGAKGFSVNGKGYVLRREYADNFWEYDPISNSWTALPDIPTGWVDYPHLPDAGFVIGNRLFVYSADGTTGANQLWEFDFANSEWLPRAAPTDSDLVDNWTTGFSVNGYGYVRATYDLYKYLPGSDTWVAELQDVPGKRERSLAFVINGKVYFGTSWTGAVDLWEFDPEYE